MQLSKSKARGRAMQHCTENVLLKENNPGKSFLPKKIERLPKIPFAGALRIPAFASRRSRTSAAKAV
jgi:hypothetical protein